MIETDGGGSITVRVCSDPANPGATLTIPVESAGDHDAAQDQHCPWGALAVAPIVPDTPALPETLARAEPVPAAAPLLGYAPGIASPLPPSTDRKSRGQGKRGAVRVDPRGRRIIKNKN